MSRVISELPGMRKAVLVPGHERREQELDENAIAQQVKNTQFLRAYWQQNKIPGFERPRGWVAQHHTRYNDSTAKVLEGYGIQPIVLVRNIFDLVPSLYDHLSGNAEFIKNGEAPQGTHQNMSMAYVADDALRYDKDTFLDFIADMVIPWYFNFYTTWTRCPNAALVTYEDMRADSVKALDRAFRKLRVRFTTKEITTALEKASSGKTRMNKGETGRGGGLPDRVRDKIVAYARYYPGIDFSPIGIGEPENSTHNKNLKRIGD